MNWICDCWRKFWSWGSYHVQASWGAFSNLPARSAQKDVLFRLDAHCKQGLNWIRFSLLLSLWCSTHLVSGHKPISSTSDTTMGAHEQKMNQIQRFFLQTRILSHCSAQVVVVLKEGPVAGLGALTRVPISRNSWREITHEYHIFLSLSQEFLFLFLLWIFDLLSLQSC